MVAEDMGAGGDAALMCTLSSQCSDGEPICAANMCRLCLGASDDGQCAVHNPSTPRCGSSGTCVACRTDTQAMDCTGTSPVCGSNNTCRACQANAECTTGICKLDGSCAQLSEIEYVKNDAGATCVSSGTGAGSMTKPWCQIDNAVQNSASHYFIVAKGAYSQVTDHARSFTMTFVGPWNAAGLADTDSAVIAQSNAAAVSMMTGTNTVDLTLDGVVISTLSANVKMNAHSGVELLGGGTAAATFRLVRSTVKNNQNQGLNINSATLYVDQSIIMNNAGGGVQLQAADYSLTNSLLLANGTSGATGSAFGGVSLPITANTKILYNLTVVNNLAMTGLESGLSCAGITAFNNTVLFGNSTADFTMGKCQPATSAYVSATSPNISLTGCAASDVFQDSTTFHLTTSNPVNPSCVLIDKGATPPSSANVPAHDLFGRARPQRNAWDIGSDEEP